jgi:hypothetical protein
MKKKEIWIPIRDDGKYEMPDGGRRIGTEQRQVVIRYAVVEVPDEEAEEEKPKKGR